jgi:hypothetical protein
MHPQQKVAWFTLIVVGGTLVLYAVAIPTMGWWFHRTLAGAAGPASGVFGLLGLTGFARKLYRVPKGGPLGKMPVMDERDWQLSKQAWSAGMAIFWLVFVLAGMGVWAWLSYAQKVQQITLSVDTFPRIILGSWIVFALAQSLAILHYYGWKASDVPSQ